MFTKGDKKEGKRGEYLLLALEKMVKPTELFFALL